MKHTRTTPPSHVVFVVEGEGDSAHWTRIGAAWPHDDGEGFNLKLACMPLDGRVVIRKLKPKDMEAGR
ncbi:hypothetical protein [Ancylobacter polymorphus]|uniref:Uncharacterized protein n=1 Tax=Ancylobacter polymorphus TaxID=223390 RepID=A0A9E6ZYI3_9HYPH|nr:hypothetical protein [Ancylobacter polymorphus]UOK73964.1 hypothetical protein K9D25_24795 [Ancylobacter polymorphus]